MTNQLLAIVVGVTLGTASLTVFAGSGLMPDWPGRVGEHVNAALDPGMQEDALNDLQNAAVAGIKAAHARNRAQLEKLAQTATDARAHQAIASALADLDEAEAKEIALIRKQPGKATSVTVGQAGDRMDARVAAAQGELEAISRAAQAERERLAQAERDRAAQAEQERLAQAERQRLAQAAAAAAARAQRKGDDEDER
jgi:fused signal recognition particle receptor